MTPETIEITQDEMRADMERAAEQAEREAQGCVGCKHARWLGAYGHTKTFRARVDNPVGLGVCIIDGDAFEPIGITTKDIALGVDCDLFEAVER